MKLHFILKQTISQQFDRNKLIQIRFK